MAKPAYTLQLTNGFQVDFPQLSRVLEFAIQQQDLGRVPAEAYQISLGLSQRKSQSLNALAGAFMLVKSVVLTPTDLGKLIHHYNPYLDDMGTLWLLHYIIGSDKRYVIWNRLVNQIIPENTRISTAIARPYFDDLAAFYSERTMDNNVRSEVGAVWNAYTEQALGYLDYIRAESEQIYVRGDREPVSPHIFCAALLSYRERFAPKAVTLDVAVLASNANSPGRVFGLTNRRVRDLLEDAKGLGFIYVETRADLDQVRFRDDCGFLGVVQRYYEER